MQDLGDVVSDGTLNVTSATNRRRRRARNRNIINDQGRLYGARSIDGTAVPGPGIVIVEF